MKNKIPKFVAPCLWSYDINRLNIEEDKELIIRQVLNYGNIDRLKWLFSVYTEKDIKNIILNPQKGMWFPKVLNFWEIILNIKINKTKKEKAIVKNYIS